MRAALLLLALFAAGPPARADATTPAPAAAPGGDDPQWNARCDVADDPHIGWASLRAQLAVELEPGGRARMRGRLRFVERVANARLSGRWRGGALRLAGGMKEVGGLETHWPLEAELRRGESPYQLDGTLYELLPDGGRTAMCRFTVALPPR